MGWLVRTLDIGAKPEDATLKIINETTKVADGDWEFSITIPTLVQNELHDFSIYETTKAAKIKAKSESSCYVELTRCLTEAEQFVVKFKNQSKLSAEEKASKAENKALKQLTKHVLA